MDRSTGGPSLLSEIKNPHISQQITEFQFRPGFSIPSPADTTGCVAGFYAQVSMAGRSMNRLWHKMVAAAVGSCIHVCRGSRGATGISLSKETGRGADPPRADGTSAAERLALLSSLFSFSLLRLLFIGNSPSHRICISSSALLFPQHSSVSVLGGIHCSPQACLRLC